ncbi:tripartite tricarboxylate transporter substrate binding protein [Haladaptatus sp. DFWS20]|uniref:tripartite tricarboxylate transporter substrate binding protein n=1 Tax=Haladaptatus sp. DFWS20 TaxID=3403467 RepID=UPI003EC02B9B
MVGNQSPGRVENEESRNQTSVRRRNFVKAVSGVGVISTAGCLDKLSRSSSQSWPSGQMEIIAPWAAGGGSDRTSRAVADAAENHTEVSWNVKNQTGGSGSVGMNAVANAKPNGLTLGCTAPEICLFEHLGIADLSPDDITPIMQYTQMPATIVVHENSKYKSLDKFLSFAKSNPGKIKMANSGTGSSWHMAGAAFVHEAGIDVKHVPYDGAKPAITATLNGEVDCATVGAVEVAPQVRDGSLKSLGVMYDEKLDSLPQTPTMKQQGVDIVIGSWLAHFGPKDLPNDVRDSIVETYNSVYEDKKFKKFMGNNNFMRVKRGPDELKKFLDQKYKYYGQLVKDLDINK